MPTYLDEKRRRIRQFAEYLRLMGLRAHKVVKDSSFIIFGEAPPEDAESPKLKESVAIKADCLCQPNGRQPPPEQRRPGDDYVRNAAHWQGVQL